MKTKLLFILTIIYSLNVSFAQSIISVSPTSAAAGQTLNVTITGSGTHFTSGSSTTYVDFGFSSCSGTTVNSVTVNSDINVTANVTIPSSYIYSRIYDVQVHDPADGYLIGDHFLNVTGGLATPITLSPDSGAAGQTLTVTITGNGTNFLQGSYSTLDFSLDTNQKVCSRTWVSFYATPSSNTLASAVITIPPGTPGGYYDLMFDGGLHYYFLENMFHVIFSVSVNEVEEEYKLSFGPNPFNSYSYLEYTLENSERVITEVYDLFGRRILEKDSGRQLPGKYKLTIDAADLDFTSGIYLLRFTAGNRSFTKRIMLIAD